MRAAFILFGLLLVCTSAGAAEFPIIGIYGSSTEACAAFVSGGEAGFNDLADDKKMLVSVDTIRAAGYTCVIAGAGRPTPLSCTGADGTREATVFFALNARGITMKLDDGTTIDLDRCH